MRILYFGTYEQTYPRNAQVISCLRRAGVEVVERHEPVWERSEQKWATGIRAAPRLVVAQARLARRAAGRYDAVVVGYPGHLDLPAARRAAGTAPVVFNPLVSLSDTLVGDRGRFRAGSLPARALRAIDRYALRSADLVIADTDANADFLAELARIPRERVAVCFVGAEERVFTPGWEPRDPPLFVGKLIPLHGLDTILRAASLAAGERLRVVGSGQLEPLLADRPPNVEWRRWIQYERLAGELRRAVCALGIFGTSDKARRVIPNKVFQALACGTPVITGDTPGARELLVDEESALLVPPGDPEALAAALRRLTGDEDLQKRLSTGGLSVYRERASEAVLGERWRSLLERLV
jgi:glycosyltransferase involved in cell wall biosynthesis